MGILNGKDFGKRNCMREIVGGCSCGRENWKVVLGDLALGM
jgi:hypothetical protein